MKYIRPGEIIHSKEFLREPVHDTFKEIENIPTSKIVLRGEGTGRSTLLYYMQEKKANTEKPFINLNLGCVFYSKQFSPEFFKHYLELRFSGILLRYIKDYYELFYHSDFSKYSDVYNHIQQLEDFVNESFYKEVKLPKMFSTKEITGEIIEKFKKLMHVESLEIGIDNFDCTNNKDELTQKILYSYFDLFDKTIITANDESLPQEWYKTYFNENSELFTFIPYTIEYGQYLEIIYNIIERRVIEYNSSLYEECRNNNCSYKPFPLSWLDYDTLKLLKNKTNGNIRLILDIINELTQLWKLNGNITQKNIEDAIQNKVEQNTTIKLQYSQHKLYL